MELTPEKEINHFIGVQTDHNYAIIVLLSKMK